MLSVGNAVGGVDGVLVFLLLLVLDSQSVTVPAVIAVTWSIATL